MSHKRNFDITFVALKHFFRSLFRLFLQTILLLCCDEKKKVPGLHLNLIVKSEKLRE